MIKSINFKIITLNESKKSLTALTFLPGSKIMPIPKNNAKKITWSILRLLEAARNIFEGTMSTSAFSGPDSLCLAAASCLVFVSVEYASINSFRVLTLIDSPGLIILTKIKPIVTAISVVIK